MPTITNNVIDQYGRPVPSAQVWIRDEDGALVDLDEGNPLITDSSGVWSTYLAPGDYDLLIIKGDAFVQRAQVACLTDEDARPTLRQFTSVATLDIENDIIARPNKRVLSTGTIS